MCSLSKACFVYNRRPKNKIPTKKVTFESEPLDPSKENRLAHFDEAWTSCEEQIQVLNSDTHAQFLGDLLGFIEDASKKMHEWQSNRVIPTAALIAGVNVPDHSAVFEALRIEIVKRFTPYATILTADDASNIKSLIKKLVFSLVSVNLEGNEEAGDDNDGQTLSLSPVKRSHLTMPVLASWYSNVTAPRRPFMVTDSSVQNNQLSRIIRSPRKRPKLERVMDPVHVSTDPVVVVLRNLEACPPDVLQKFVAILSEYANRVPFVLVFGMSSSSSSVHDILSRSTLSNLAIETFTLLNPSFHLDVILKKILISHKFHFKLGPKVFQLFDDVFLFNDLSVKTFLSRYKFCMMEHYYENPLSVLCCDWGVVDDRIENLDSESIECVRRLSSFRSYVEQQPLKDQRGLLLDDKHVKSVLRNLLYKLHSYHYEFFPVLYCLHAVVSDLPKSPLGKQLRDVYFTCLAHDVADMEEFHHCMSLLSVMAKEELVKRMALGCEAIRGCDFPSLAVSSVWRSIQGVIDRMAENDVELEDENEARSTKSKNGSRPSKRMDRFELQQWLKSNMVARNEKSYQSSVGHYSALREEVIDILRQAVKKFLVCPKRIVLNEIFYFDSLASVQSQLIGGSRAALQGMALVNPHSYFKCDCCMLEEEGSILGTFPDICIAYKLHLECGRLINLYDWLQAFIMVTEQGSSQKDTSKDAKPADQLMARFIRSVAELQFLGFVKGTTRKTDHVARLTW